MTKCSIYIVSREELSGKSIILISLGLLFKESGKKVGYFKPLGLKNIFGVKDDFLDKDINMIKNILDLEDNSELICPFNFTKDEFLQEISKINSTDFFQRIILSYNKISQNKEVILIEGPSTISMGYILGYPVPKLAKKFNSKLLLVEKYKDDFVVDNVLQAKDFCIKWNIQLFGVILNCVPRIYIEKVKDIIKPLLERNGIKVLGIIPEDDMLKALTVREVQEVLNGNILAGKDGLDNKVETVLVGAMTPESALKYFQKAKNEMIITGGDRTDIIIAALKAGTSALILTGNLYPNVKILSQADELSVPVILIPYDTYTTLQIVQKIVGRINPKDKKRVNRMKELVKENVDWKLICE
jgi:BioD-like phosphotransacetylase family protein